MKKSFVVLFSAWLSVGGALTSFASTEDDGYPKSAADHRAEDGGSVLELFGKKKGEPLIKRSAPGREVQQAKQATKPGKVQEQRTVTNISDKSSVAYRECLWRVMKEEFRAYPMQVSDFQGGVLATDWFDVPGRSNERQKFTALILGNQLKQKPDYEFSITVKREIFQDGRWQGKKSISAEERAEMEASIKQATLRIERECK